jgi:tetratricopeptide (TPR) repeat protein
LVRIILTFILSLLVATAPARAEWTEISSEHFLIYGEQSAKILSRFAERLEYLHAAMALRHAPRMEKPSPSNRVTIYAVSSGATVRRLAEASGHSMVGIYIPRAGATMALTPRIFEAADKLDMGGETILYHEYAHHFMHMLTNRAFPKWVSEGVAEFYSGLKFTDEIVGVGLPAYHRAGEFAYGIKVPMPILLRAEGDEGTKNRDNSFYAQSWLLVHYLTFSQERAPQFPRYMKLLSEGATDLDAARQAFGDLEKLSDDLDDYYGRRSISYLPIKKARLQIGNVTARVLSKGMSESMFAIIRAQRGVDGEEAKQLASEMRSVAARYPDDADVLVALAESEIDAGQLDSGIAAADRALALAPQSIKALIQKGRAAFAKAEASNKDEDWQVARRLYLAANRIEPDHPIPLIQFYTTFRKQGIAPNKSAIAGLERASQLAPFDLSLLLTLAEQRERDGRLHDAIIALGPIAYNPHRDEASAQALAHIKDLQAQIARKTATQ